MNVQERLVYEVTFKLKLKGISPIEWGGGGGEGKGGGGKAGR